MLKLAEKEGFEVDCWQAGFESLESSPRPVILVVDDPELGKNSYVVLCKTEQHKADKNYILYHPMKGMIALSKTELDSLWTSRIYLSLELNKKSSEKQERKQTSKWLLASIADKWPIFTVSLVAQLIQACACIGLFFIMSFLIDSWLPSANNQLPVKPLIAASILLIIILLMQVLYKNLKNVSSYVDSSYQLNNFNFSIFNTTTVPVSKNKHLLNKFLDLSDRKTQLFNLLNHAFSTLIILLLIAGFLFFTDLKTIGCLCALTGIIFLITNRAKGNITSKQARLSAHKTNLMISFNAMLESMNVVTASNRENEFCLKACKENYSYQDQLYQLRKTRNRFTTYKNIFFLSFLFLILLAGLSDLKDKETLPGQFFLLLALSTFFSLMLDRLSLCAIKYDEIKTAHLNNNEEHSFQVVKSHKNNTSALSTDFKHLEIYLSDGERAEPCFTISRGELNYLNPINSENRRDLLLTFSQPESSENYQIIANHFKYGEIPPDTRKKVVATIFSEPFIFNDSIAYNIAFNDVTHIHEALLRFIFKYGLDDYIKHFPESLATIIGSSGHALKTMDKVIIAIARALYQGAGLLVIDEKFLAVEDANAGILETFLFRIKEDITVIILNYPHSGVENYFNKTLAQTKPSVYE